MNKQRYYPARQADQVVWLSNFRNKLAVHAAVLALKAEWVADKIKDAAWVAHLLGRVLPAARAHAKALTQAVRQAESGTGGLALIPVFTPPELAEGVEVRDEGALNRVFDAVQVIKTNDRYNQMIGEDLGIIAPEEAAPDYATLAPRLKLSVQGNVVEIRWSWQGYAKFLDMIEIQVDRGTGWEVLTYDISPGYTDKHPHPDTPSQWKYRAIYRVDDEQVGQWGPVVKVNVGG